MNCKDREEEQKINRVMHPFCNREFALDFSNPATYPFYPKGLGGVAGASGAGIKFDLFALLSSKHWSCPFLQRGVRGDF